MGLGLGFIGGGGRKCQFYFYGRGDFSELFPIALHVSGIATYRYIYIYLSLSLSLKWPGDSQRESGRFATGIGAIRANQFAEKPLFS